MARITVEDCLKRIPSRFLLVNMVAKRVRQIREGSEYLVNSPKNEDIVVSLREIAAGKINTLSKKSAEVKKISAADVLDALQLEATADPETEADDAAEVETEGEAPALSAEAVEAEDKAAPQEENTPTATEAQKDASA